MFGDELFCDFVLAEQGVGFAEGGGAEAGPGVAARVVGEGLFQGLAFYELLAFKGEFVVGH